METLLLGDCLTLLKTMADASVDSLITDPPAGISFMGKAWDDDKGGRKQWVAWMSEVMGECLRVMKPGAHGLVWAIPRTSHWTATALEDAGFEIRDVVTHLFGSGFPKSMDISKAIDKQSGAEREVIGKRTDGRYAYDFSPAAQKSGGIKGKPGKETKQGGIITEPASIDSKQWQGWGTALKPASEHWILVRKPCSEKTVAANVLKHGVGGINIDASRIGENAGWSYPNGPGGNKINGGNLIASTGGKRTEPVNSTQGRFPANLLFSHNEDCVTEETYVEDSVYPPECSPDCAVAMLDAQSGTLKSGKMKANTIRSNTKGYTGDMPTSTGAETIGDSGGASRFFYCAKASKKDKNAGLEGMEKKQGGTSTGATRPNKPAGLGANPQKVVEKNENFHPTVKSSTLMSYLIKLITPPNGVVLDPFMGSGSTGVAAVRDNFKFLGIEMDEAYFEIARTRIQAGI